MGATASPEIVEAMRVAIAASEQVRGSTSPNPPVGCVVLDRAGRIVGRGATEPPGGAHAEVVALRAAGDRAVGGTAVVTLEPCAHTGRTEPCAKALIDAGIARVVHAETDPNPPAAGGARVLAQSGVEVIGGVLADEVRAGPLRGWLHWMNTSRPHVTWKYAASLDGRSAAEDGTSQWISSAESRAQVHRIRAHMDAIVAGTGTVLADDPRLTARDESGAVLIPSPLRVVVGDRDLPPDARVFDSAADTVTLRAQSPARVLDELGERGVVEVLLEGGPTLAGAFLAAGCVDRVEAFVAPALLGSGPNALGYAGVASISQAWRLSFERVTMCGPDVWISAVPLAG